MSRRGADLGFLLVSEEVPDVHPPRKRTVARFLCGRGGCVEHLDVRLSPNHNLEPEHLAKKAKEAGWYARPYGGRGATRCPACSGGASADPAPGVEASVAAAPSPDAAGSGVPSPDPDVPAGPPRGPLDALALPPMPDTPPPDAARLGALRGLLDGCFDPGGGGYAPGWDDARAASESGVALEWVEYVRRAAYGEARPVAPGPSASPPPPSLDADEASRLRAEAAAVASDLSAAGALLAEVEQRALDAVAEVRAEVAGLRERLSAVHAALCGGAS